MRIDWGDVTKELGNQFSELNAPAFLMPMLTKKDLAQKQIQDAAVEQQAKDTAAKVAGDNNPDAEVTQDPNGIHVQHQQRELINFKDVPSDAKNAVLASLGYPPSQIVAEEAKAQLANAKSEQLDTEVKEQMVNAARQGQLDPETLAKFISK